MSCPGGRALLAAALCCRGRFCVCAAHHFLSLVNGVMGEGLCYMSSLIAGHCTLVKSRVQKPASWQSRHCARKRPGEKQKWRAERGYRKKGSISFVWAVTATTNTGLIFAPANLVRPALRKVNARLKKNVLFVPLLLILSSSEEWRS